ncbi:MAG: C45 family peptidase [Ornithinimicrobium sp.]
MTTTPTLPRHDAHWSEWVTYGRAWAQQSYRSSTPATRPAPAAPAPTRSPAFGATKWTSDDTETVQDWRAATLESAPVGDSSSAGLRSWPITFYAYREETPGPRWQALWEVTRSAYLAFYRRDGLAQRPTLRESRAALAEHMPELMPTYERLVDLTGGTGNGASNTGDEDDESSDTAASLLTMWRLPIFAAGCSQVAIGGEAPTLSRNYDYDPNLFEGVIASTNYSGKRAVLGTSDMLWGLVDGMNEDGLAISMTYGGRKGGGVGFAIPLVVRYLLEVCGTVEQACERLRGLPVAQAYNLAMVDRSGARATVFVAPGEEPEVRDHAVSTNHRLDRVEHPEIAGPLASLERQQDLSQRVQQSRDVNIDDVQGWLGQEPMFANRYSSGFGTLYTVSYEPKSGTAQYRWGQRTLTRTFSDGEAEFPVVLRGH